MRGIEAARSCVIGDQVSVTPSGVSAGQGSNLGTDPTSLLRNSSGSRDSATSELMTSLIPTAVYPAPIEWTIRS